MIAIAPTPHLDGDVSYARDGTIVEGHDLETVVWLSLFCDAPARQDDVVPHGATRRGFWADAYASNDDVWGSRLWLLERAKVTSAALSDAVRFAEEALAWLVTDGLASRVEAAAEKLVVAGTARGIALTVRIHRPGDATPLLFGPWEALRGI